MRGRGQTERDWEWRASITSRRRSSPSCVRSRCWQGKPVADAVRTIGVTEATYYRWRAEYGGLKLDQVRRLKVLGQENGRLRWAVADLTLEKLVLKEAASGNF